MVKVFLETVYRVSSLFLDLSNRMIDRCATMSQDDANEIEKFVGAKMPEQKSDGSKNLKQTYKHYKEPKQFNIPVGERKRYHLPERRVNHMHFHSASMPEHGGKDDKDEDDTDDDVVAVVFEPEGKRLKMDDSISTFSLGDKVRIAHCFDHCCVPCCQTKGYSDCPFQESEQMLVGKFGFIESIRM
jgi:hypothetical protein